MGPVSRGALSQGPPRGPRGPRGEPQLSADGYRIDYDDLDVVDLVGQIRERARRGEAEPNVVAGPEARVHARLRAAVDVDDARAHELQRELGLEGDWNITPDDLIGKQGAGGPLTFLRRLARPGVKLFANLETPLFKQFKINMGIAEALHELLRRTAELEQGLDDVARRLEALEARRAGSAASTDKKSD